MTSRTELRRLLARKRAAMKPQTSWHCRENRHWACYGKASLKRLPCQCACHRSRP